MSSADKISNINYQVYSDKNVVDHYFSGESLQEPEEAILDEIKEKVKGKQILDIGVGVGRTIPYLTKISSDYIGIDYSEAMVEECNKRYPHVKVIQYDARDMSDFKDEEFNLVFFAYNAIDYVSHNDRLQVLKEIYRVLKRDGYFVFSAHNRECDSFKQYLSAFCPLFTHNPLKPFTLNPGVIFERFHALSRAFSNHRQNSKYVVHADEYSIINDKEQDYTAMTYYISVNRQKEQLKDIGFESNVRAFDRYGKEITETYSRNTWVYYLASKKAT